MTKRYCRLIIAIVVLQFSFGFCKAQINEALIIGSWKVDSTQETPVKSPKGSDSSMRKQVFTFFADNSFSVVGEEGKGRYLLSKAGKKLFLIMDNNNIGMGTIMEIVTLNDKRLIIQAEMPHMKFAIYYTRQ